jgi:hypothetical protein
LFARGVIDVARFFLRGLHAQGIHGTLEYFSCFGKIMRKISLFLILEDVSLKKIPPVACLYVGAFLHVSLYSALT